VTRERGEVQDWLTAGGCADDQATCPDLSAVDDTPASLRRDEQGLIPG
jgi:hypothetical protein